MFSLLFSSLFFNSGSAQNLSIQLAPTSPPIQLPAGGGSFNFDAAVINNEITPQNFSVWILVQLPSGAWYGPVLGPVNLTLPAGASISRNRNQTVPGIAPAGWYTYEGRLGNYPGAVWDADRFQFVKLAEGVMDTLWTHTYGGNGYEIGACVLETRDGGFAVVGSTNSCGAGDYDLLLLKTDAAGTQIWQKTFGTEGWDGGNFIRETQDGGFILVGTSHNGNDGDVYLVRTNSAGDSIWSRTFGGAGYDDGRCVRQTSDGGFILTGCTTLSGTAGKDVYLIKTNAQGDEIWSRTFGGDYDDVGNSLLITPDGGYLIVGYTYLDGTDNCDVYLIKTDAAGHSVWSRTVGGGSWDYGLDVESTQDGGYVISGYTYSYGAGLTDVYLFKTDAQGNLIWQRTFGGAGYDFGRAVEPLPGGGFLIAGSTDSFGWGEADAYLITTNPNGEETESYNYGGAQVDEARDVRGTQDGGCILAGTTNSFGAGSGDVYLLRLAPISNSERRVFFPPPVETSPLPGWMHPSSLEISSELITKRPSGSGSFITFSLAQASTVALDLFDICGRRIEVGYPRLIFCASGFQSIPYDRSVLAAGIYIYRIRTGAQTICGKLIVTK
jgi:hypothetical protein